MACRTHLAAASGIRLRYLHATGQPARDEENGQNVLRSTRGYWELTPGTYRGTRYYFNGRDGNVGDGSGLGHSINNTRMLGMFWTVDDPNNSHLGYRGGFYWLRHIHGVRDASGSSQREIGLEFDNMLTWYVHKAGRMEFELNVFRQGAAFTYDDFTPADGQEADVFQGIARFVYEF